MIDNSKGGGEWNLQKPHPETEPTGLLLTLENPWGWIWPHGLSRVKVTVEQLTHVGSSWINLWLLYFCTLIFCVLWKKRTLLKLCPSVWGLTNVRGVSCGETSWQLTFHDRGEILMYSQLFSVCFPFLKVWERLCDKQKMSWTPTTINRQMETFKGNIAGDV